MDPLKTTHHLEKNEIIIADSLDRCALEREAMFYYPLTKPLLSITTNYLYLGN
jgi:hypothetical protein